MTRRMSDAQLAEMMVEIAASAVEMAMPQR